MPEAVTVPEAMLGTWVDGPAHGVRVAVTTRHGGVSAPPYDTLNLGLHVGDHPDAVRTNRERAAAAFGVELDRVVFARQVHGAGVTVVGADEAGRGTRGEEDAIDDCDALVTKEPGVTLAILVADCVPLALVDPAAGVLAAVHAGWRGTAAGVVAAALDVMVEQGARPDRIWAYLGPAVAPDRYQVGAEVQQGLAGAVAPDPLDPRVVRPDGPGHWRVDLVAANVQQLRRAGVPAAQIAHSELHTGDASLFSDRTARPCGRFALLARLLA